MAQMMAQVGMPWLVTDMSVKVHETSLSGHDPLGVWTVVAVTEMSPIETSTGSPPIMPSPGIGWYWPAGWRAPPGCWNDPGQPCCPDAGS